MIRSVFLAALAFGGLVMATPSFAFATGVGVVADSFSPQVVSVPEPATWVLLVGGSLGVGYLAQRRRKPSAPKA